MICSIPVKLARIGTKQFKLNADVVLVDKCVQIRDDRFGSFQKLFNEKLIHLLIFFFVRAQHVILLSAQEQASLILALPQFYAKEGSEAQTL